MNPFSQLVGPPEQQCNVQASVALNLLSILAHKELQRVGPGDVVMNGLELSNEEELTRTSALRFMREYLRTGPNINTSGAFTNLN